jgi:hypothetical protein
VARRERWLPFLFVASSAIAYGSRARAAERTTKGPYVTGLTDTGGTVRFELSSPARATVEVVADAPLKAADGGVHKTVFESRDASAFHAVRIAGLEPATRYRYVVRVEGAASGDGLFSTAPRSDSAAPIAFLVYGDNRTDDAAHAAVVRAMMAVPSDFLVNTGDMVPDGGSAENWQTFFDIEKPLLHDRPLFAAIGNHELYDDTAGGNFARYFGLPDSSGALRPYGTARIGNVRLFFLNGMHGWDSGEERQWLERALGEADHEADLVWRFVVLHHGPWSAGPHGPNVQLVEARVPELLASHKVDLLFAGHDHLYERGDAGVLKYFVSGGGGAPLYRDWHPTATTRKAEATHHFIEVSTSAGALRIVARRSDGSILDRCGFAQGRPWDCDPPVASQSASPGQGSGQASAPPAADGGEPKLPDTSSPDSSARCLCDAPGSVSPGAAPVSALVSAVVGLAALSRRRARSGKGRWR